MGIRTPGCLIDVPMRASTSQLSTILENSRIACCFFRKRKYRWLYMCSVAKTYNTISMILLLFFSLHCWGCVCTKVEKLDYLFFYLKQTSRQCWRKSSLEFVLEAQGRRTCFTKKFLWQKFSTAHLRFPRPTDIHLARWLVLCYKETLVVLH